MPIKPENLALYPADWALIRQRILTRANNRCERCGLPNGLIVQRLISHPEIAVDGGTVIYGANLNEPIRIVLTIAHLDSALIDHSDRNLQALCQRCHFLLDREANRNAAAQTRRSSHSDFGMVASGLVVLGARGRLSDCARRSLPLHVLETPMRLLISGNTRQVRDLAVEYSDHLGHLITPTNANRYSVVRSPLPFGADNGAFSGFDAARFRKLLELVGLYPTRCLWVVCPDVVADARGTLALFGHWRDEVAATGAPVAFVGQDGAEDLDLCWDSFDAWFIGGSTRWKLSHASADLAAEAKRLGKAVHMGRVNSMRRLRVAIRFGCDSADGSSYSRFHHRTITDRPDMSLDRHLRFLRAFERQEIAQLTLWKEDWDEDL